MVVWLVGLSGAGKSTIGRELHKSWQKKDPNTVFIDGDEIRAIFKHDQLDKSYTIDQRRKNAERIIELCLWLDKQNINIVCCILCIFPDILSDNRQRFSEYFEAYISAPMQTLKDRDTKGLYAAAEAGELKNLVGVDIPFSEPENPDIVLDTSDTKYTINNLVDNLMETLINKTNRGAVVYEYATGNRLENRNTYFYTPYLGNSFIDSWKANREQALHFCSENTASSELALESDNPFSGEAILESLYQDVLSGDINDRVLLLIQRFEVGKRLYNEYDENMRPTDRNAYTNYSLYLRFGELLSLAYRDTLKLNFLNPFIKVMDLLISLKDLLSSSQSDRLASLIEKENIYISALMKRFEINS